MESGVLDAEYNCIAKELESSAQFKRKKKTYHEDEKLKIAKYANTHGFISTVSLFKQDFPDLKESTVCPWVAKYRSEVKKTSGSVQISERRGRPLLLPEELDTKLHKFITSTRTAGETINKHVIYGILMGLIKSDLSCVGCYLDFAITNGWLQSLYRWMGFTRRIVTTSRPAITKVAWLEVKSKFLHDIVSSIVENEIPDKLMINVDQTPSKFAPTDNVRCHHK